MKNSFLVFFTYAMIFLQTSCLKNNRQEPCTVRTIQSEEPEIVSYASANGINATRDSSGLYYEIISPGSGVTPDSNSTVFVTYTGSLLDGTLVIDQPHASQTGWKLGTLIIGWQKGLSLIRKGGRIKLIIPSSLGYGCEHVGPIPPNSVLYTDIQLVDVQ